MYFMPVVHFRLLRYEDQQQQNSACPQRVLVKEETDT